jgi:3-oxoacyl-[acyl-carrier protein] reductase
LVVHARKAGHQVVFTGRDRSRVDSIARETGAHGVVADVSTDADNARSVQTCMQEMGGIDVLVNNAGVGYSAEIGSIDMSSMRSLFGTNVFGMVDLTNRVAPLMKAQGSGDIINIASTSGTKGAKGATVYAGSKWAVRGISQCWQAELRPFGIRVMCLLPSEVQTNWMGRTGRNNPNKLFPRDIAATIFAALDMPRNVLWPELAIFANNPWKED